MNDKKLQNQLEEAFGDFTQEEEAPVRDLGALAGELELEAPPVSSVLHQLLERAFEATADAVFIADRDGFIEYQVPDPRR